MRKVIITLTVLAAAFVVACGASANANEPSPTPTPAVDPNTIADPQDALDAARALWAANGGDNYAMTFNWQCFCIVDYVQRVDLEVRDGHINAGTVSESGVALTSDQLVEYQSVDQLFEVIQNAIDEDAAEIRVTYASAGYPAEVWLDFSFQIADEERGFFIHELSLT